MQNLFLKKDYKTYLTVLLDNTSTGEVAIWLNDSTGSEMGYLLLEPGTVREESIFYHRREGNVVYCYGVNRDNPVEHLVNAVVYMANSIDYMNYIISQTNEQGFIYKKSVSHIIVKGGYFYFGGENVLIDDVDTSAAVLNKSLFVNAINYIYLKDGDFFITTIEDNTLLLIGKVITSLDGTITSITKYNIAVYGTQGDQGIPGKQVEFNKSATHLQWRYVGDPTWTNLVLLEDISGSDGIDGDDGRGIVSVVRTAGTGAAGTTDTYTITYTIGATSTFTVYNGADGLGVGDMLESIYDPTGKSADAFSMGNMDETATKKILTDTERTAISTIASKESSSNKGAAGGYAPLDGSSKIDPTYLPSYVNDVEEYANFVSLPVIGETGKVYITIDNNREYRWSGSVYVELKDSGEDTGTIGALINSATAKTTPVDADMFGIMDSAASNILKKLSWSNIKATLKTYFDTLYPSDASVVHIANPEVITGGKAFTNYLSLNNDSDAPFFFNLASGVSRWAFFKNSAQSLVINRYNNSGVYQDSPLDIDGTNGYTKMTTGLYNYKKLALGASKDSNGSVQILGEIEVGYSGGAWGDGYIGINAPSTTPYDTAPIRAITINSSGNVGINTPLPAYRLDVKGLDDNTSGQIRVRDGGLGRSILIESPRNGLLMARIGIVGSSSSMGIGTRDFIDALQVNGATGNTETVGNIYVNGADGVEIGQQIASGSADAGIRMRSSGWNRFIFDSGSLKFFKSIADNTAGSPIMEIESSRLRVYSHIIADAGVIVGNNTGTVAGTIRWNGTKFQGYTGTVWVDFH